MFCIFTGGLPQNLMAFWSCPVLSPEGGPGDVRPMELAWTCRKRCGRSPMCISYVSICILMYLFIDLHIQYWILQIYICICFYTIISRKKCHESRASLLYVFTRAVGRFHLQFSTGQALLSKDWAPALSLHSCCRTSRVKHLILDFVDRLFTDG